MKNIYHEELWVHGDFIPCEDFFKMKDFLNTVISEESSDMNKFDKELLDENNWYIKKRDWKNPRYLDSGDI